MTIEKPFKTVDEQISLLKERRLNFINLPAARQLLKEYGYYEIVNGYKKPFLKNPNNDDEGYKDNENFEHIFSLYRLDGQIRIAVMSSTEVFEQTFKQSIAYVIAENISAEYSTYISQDFYIPGEIHRGTSDRDRLLHTMNKIHNSSLNPYKHYRDSHGNVPPWILIKGLSLGQAIYWFTLLKNKRFKDEIISRMTGLNINLIDGLDEQFKIRNTFSDALMLILSYRNLAAHGGRIYNYRSALHQLTVYSKWLYNPNNLNCSHRKFLDGKLRSSLGTLLGIMKLFENEDCFEELQIWLGLRIKSYLSNYPNDEKYIFDSTELTKKTLDWDGLADFKPQ